MDIVALTANILTSSGPLAALAIFAIWLLNCVWKDRLDAEKRHSEQIAQLLEQAHTTIERNTEAMTRLSECLSRSSE